MLRWDGWRVIDQEDDLVLDLQIYKYKRTGQEGFLVPSWNVSGHILQASGELWVHMRIPILPYRAVQVESPYPKVSLSCLVLVSRKE